MRRADYSYTIYRDGIGPDVLMLVDEGTSTLSLTNDIEKCVAETLESINKKPGEILVIYKDSEDSWDGYDPAKLRFILLGKDRAEDAVRAIRKHYIEQQISSNAQ